MVTRNRITWAIGTILFVIGTVIIYWNERRAVLHGLSLEEALSDVISVRLDEPYDPKLNGQVVHLSGPLLTGEPLTEPEYNIQVLAVKLKRRVQMLQWVEETHEHVYGSSIDVMESDNSKTYYYNTEWRDQIVDTSGFHMRHGHENPATIPIETRTQIADNVNIGFYELGAAVKQKIANWVDFTSDTRPEDPSVKLHSGFYYHCNDVWNPEVGDVRIFFSFAGLEGSKYTVVGQLRDGRIEAYMSSLGVPILLVQHGEHKPSGSLQNAHYTIKKTTWMFRFAGALILLLAVSVTSSQLSEVLSRFPLVWTIAPDRRHSLNGNLLLTFVLAFTITALAWVFQRPYLGLGMLMMAFSPMVFFASNMVRYDRFPVV